MPLAYFFKHNLIQEAWYTTLTRHERKRLHTMTAHIMEADAGAALDAISPPLAQHYAAAGDDVKTLEFRGTRCQCQPTQFCDSGSPPALHAQALEALERLPDSVENRRFKVDLGLRFLDLRWSGGTADQDLAYLDKLEALSRTLVSDPSATIQTTFTSPAHFCVKGESLFCKESNVVGDGSVPAVADQTTDLGDDQLLAIPSLMLGAALVVQGFLAQALPLVTRAWRVWQDQPQGAVTGITVALVHHDNRTRGSWKG